MIHITDTRDCCGCHACANACPKQCISMQEDYEGFLYPDIEESQCIHCDLCEKVCPILNAREDYTCHQRGIVLQDRNEQRRQESTSGGAFTPIAAYVIQQGGVVFGAAFADKEYHVTHQKAETVEELKKFRGSKYVQSIIGDTYRQAKNYLKQGRKVCFSGTPCQIEGLLQYLGEGKGKLYENLVTVDVECRAVPSPFVFQKYLEVQNANYPGAIENVKFRDKTYGYSYSTMALFMKKGSGFRDYHRGIESDLWLRTFFSGVCDRPSCSACRFRGRYHRSDFTIWDCFCVDQFSPEMDDNKGTTRMLIQSEQGWEIFQQIKDAYRYIEVSADDIGEIGKGKMHSEHASISRKEFFESLHEKTATETFAKYFPYTMKIRVLQYGRYITYRLGIYKVMKTVWQKVRNLR